MSKLNLSELSAEDLQAELERRKSEETKAAEERKKQFEMNKNNFVNMAAAKFEKVNNEMVELKYSATTGANQLYERMWEIQGKEPKETKTFTLRNSDDTKKIVVSRPERFEFTDEAIVHIHAIKDILKNKFEKVNKGMYNFMNSLLVKGKEGDYDPKMLAKSRREARDLGVPELIEEFDKLSMCQRVTGSALYFRVYVRNNANSKWQDISLQFSSL